MRCNSHETMLVITSICSVRARAQRLMHTSDARRLIKIIELQLYALMRVKTDDLSRQIYPFSDRARVFVCSQRMFVYFNTDDLSSKSIH
jgi:hypothetical protein